MEPDPAVGREPRPERAPDPRGVRVTAAPSASGAGVAAIVLEPPEVPVAPTPHTAGKGLLGGSQTLRRIAEPSDRSRAHVLVDGTPSEARLVALDGERAVLLTGRDDRRRIRVLLLREAPGTGATSGVSRQEVVVEGWRVEVDLESASRAALRDRARRGREEAAHSGPTEVHAIIPGVVVSVSVGAGDEVVAGQQLLAVEAMKMQNELRAPRDGTIQRVAVAPGTTIEVGDLLLVID